MRVKNQVILGVVSSIVYLLLGLVTAVLSIYGVFFSDNLLINNLSVAVLILMIITLALDLLLNRVKTVG